MGINMDVKNRNYRNKKNLSVEEKIRIYIRTDNLIELEQFLTTKLKSFLKK